MLLSGLKINHKNCPFWTFIFDWWPPTHHNSLILLPLFLSEAIGVMSNCSKRNPNWMRLIYHLRLVCGVWTGSLIIASIQLLFLSSALENNIQLVVLISQLQRFFLMTMLICKWYGIKIEWSFEAATSQRL